MANVLLVVSAADDDIIHPGKSGLAVSDGSIHVRQVLQALQDNGLVIHAEKCVWGVQELEYLGHKISAAGVLPRVSPFRLKNFFAYKRNKANLDPFHLCFTISL